MTETKNKSTATLVAKKNKIQEKKNKRHNPFYNYTHKWLVDNKASQKMINSWEKDEVKLNKFFKNQEKK